MQRFANMRARFREARPLALLSFCLAWPLLMLLSILPPIWAVRIGRIAGACVFFLDKRHRDVSLRNLRAAFPAMRPAQRWDLARRSFENAGKTFIEFPGLMRRSEEEILESVRCVGLENITEAWKENKGLLLLTGHVGNWELSALALGYRQPPRLAFVARPLNNFYVDRWVSRIRGRCGNRIIGKRGALRQVVRSLREGFAVGMLMDQSTTGKDGLFVDFFSHPAGSSAAIAYLALRSGVKIVPAYCLRGPSDTTHTIYAHPALQLSVTGRTDLDVYVNTQRCQKILEDVIRKHPEQWFWMHRRWKWSPTVRYAGNGSENHLQVLENGRIGGFVRRATRAPAF